jgi:hypothetical protein
MLSCGYRVAGQADTLPDTVQTIAVRPFQNLTTEYKIEQLVTQAVVKEFITRTRYHIVVDESDADATFSGAVVNFLDFPTNYDPNTGRASTVQTITQLHVTLTDRAGQRLYENPHYEFRELYEVSIDPEVYFEERVAAIERASRSMARDLVSAVLEGF